MFHDQKTSGIMGLQPLAINMPLRITQTDLSEKTTLFKNRRCKLHGWKLHPVDLARLDECAERDDQDLLLEQGREPELCAAGPLVAREGFCAEHAMVLGASTSGSVV